MVMVSIHPFIQRKMIVLHDDVAVSQAARAMREHGIGCVMVSDHSSHIIGILTDRDISNGIAASGGVSDDVKIGEFMTRNLVVVDESADLGHVISLMEEHGIRRIPVVHKMSRGAERCIGIVTLDDLIAYRVINIQHLTRIVRAQLKKRFWPVRGAFIRAIDNQQELECFYGTVESKVGQGVSPEALALSVNRVLVQRLHHTAAMQFIGQLPAKLQEPLVNLPVGPDHSMTADALIFEISDLMARVASDRANVDASPAREVLRAYCSALEDWCESRVLDHVVDQLPKDISEYFGRGKVPPVLKQVS